MPKIKDSRGKMEDRNGRLEQRIEDGGLRIAKN
jgi:hypothetical protein